jgi:eukaryotic-like serine/threonine-protein kinase
MVTEYIAGRPLRGLGALTIDQALLYMRQVVGAVALCQSRRSADLPLGAAHPPISSSNVLLVDEGRVKLVESWLTPLNQIPLELAQYRAPERTEGRQPTLSTPVYALGLLLYELVIGDRPFQGSDPRAVAAAHLTTRLPTLAQRRPQLYLPALEQLISKATSRVPEQRYADAQALGEALEALWRDLGANTQRFEVPAQRRPRRPSSPPTTEIAPGHLPAGPATASPVGRLPDPPTAPIVEPDPAPVPRRARGNRNAPGALRPVDPYELRRTSILQAVVGWVVVMALLLMAGFGGYLGARFILRQFANIELPNIPSISIPVIGNPTEWFGGDEIYIVNGQPDLNLRAGPGLNTEVIGVLPSGTVVRKIGGPEVVDNVEWILVDTEVNGQPLQGWVSLNYLITER